MTPTVDVIVATRGGWPLVGSCLRHLADQTVAHRVIVVDDDSPDDTPDRVAEAFPSVTLLRNERNLGFGSTCNRGAAAGDGEIVVLLNDDADAYPNFLEYLVLPLDDPSVGAVAGRLVLPHGETESVGIVADNTLAGFARRDEVRPLTGPCGGAAAYRREAFEQVGGFDEGIFMYQEDLDLALRLRVAGWAVAAAPDAVATHVGGATAGVRSERQREWFGFARGYLLRRYRTLNLHALAAEIGVCAASLTLDRDTAAFRGRIAGWHAARGLPARTLPLDALDRTITPCESLRLRRAAYSASTRAYTAARRSAAAFDE